MFLMMDWLDLLAVQQGMLRVFPAPLFECVLDIGCFFPLRDMQSGVQEVYEEQCILVYFFLKQCGLPALHMAQLR